MFAHNWLDSGCLSEHERRVDSSVADKNQHAYAEAIVKRINSDTNDSVRCAACEALACMGKVAAVAYADLISDLLANTHPSCLRCSACSALGKMCSVMDAVQTSGDSAKQQKAPFSEAYTALMADCLQDSDESVRLAACEALGLIASGLDTATAVTSSEYVKSNAAAALAERYG